MLELAEQKANVSTLDAQINKLNNNISKNYAKEFDIYRTLEKNIRELNEVIKTELEKFKTVTKRHMKPGVINFGRKFLKHVPLSVLIPGIIMGLSFGANFLFFERKREETELSSPQRTNREINELFKEESSQYKHTG